MEPGAVLLLYHTPEAALNHMTRVIARQYAGKKIRCNVICSA